MSSSTITLLSYQEDILQQLASTIIHEHSGTLPDIQHVVVLLPEPLHAPRLRQLLLQQARSKNVHALLGPHILTLKDWLNKIPMHGLNIISDYSRELMLVDALREQPSLFGHGNPWAIADNLLVLFDELTLNQIGLPDNLEDFRMRLMEAYEVDDAGMAALNMEARLVHTLWHAWHEQMHARKQMDRNTAYLLRLANSLKHKKENEQLYVVGFHRFRGAEAQWLSALMKQQQLSLILQGEAEPLPNDSSISHPHRPLADTLTQLRHAIPASPQATPACQFFNQVFSIGVQALHQRASSFAATYPKSPISKQLKLLATAGAEEEAQAIDLQVRRCLLEGKQQIGIVTENRRLARRVRALLERADIFLQDSAGWALSTTSAAASLERWLQCVEEDFPHQAMLDFLKSPFILPNRDREEHLNTVYRLEQDIILHENIGRGLQRYCQHLEYRKKRLPTELAGRLDAVKTLLTTLSQAAEPLIALVGKKTHAPGTLLDALLKSLDILGMTQALAEDAAGVRLLQELTTMQAAVMEDNLPMDWNEFRAWLGRTLERFNFRQAAKDNRVQLMGLGQSPLTHYDALIIAGAEREYLPGGDMASPFFNDGVRRELGLNTREQRLSDRFYHFRRLLESSPQILITHRREQYGEEVLASPWVEAIVSFHKLAYGDDLYDEELEYLIAQTTTQVVTHNTTTEIITTGRPAPSVVASILPKEMSASGYQQLMNCPYQFFAARCLALAPSEAVREALEKADYGQRVHLCLEAFHQNVAKLPGPYTKALTENNRAEAITLMEEISVAVFSTDLEDNFLHRGWLKRWQDLIPEYIEWQCQRETMHWKVNHAEVQAQYENFLPDFNLKGRLDRLDLSNEGNIAVVDYKTGAIPKQDALENGEAIQLPFYVSLAEQSQSNPVTRVEYLQLDTHKKVLSVGTLEGDSLHQLKQGVEGRLKDMIKAMKQGASLPAWGDDEVCRYCDMEGLCRRETWLAEEPATDSSE